MRWSPEERLAALAEAAETLLANPDPEVVVPAVLRLTQRLFQADAYAVWRHLPGDTDWRVVAEAGLSPTYGRVAPALPEELIPESATASADVLADPSLAARHAEYRAEGICSMLYAPLRIAGRKSGSIVLYHRRPRNFEAEEIRLAAALGSLAAAAWTNAELYAEQERQRSSAEAGRRRLQFLAEASLVLSASLDLETTLQQVARLVVPQLADGCIVHVLEPGSRQLKPVAMAYSDPEKLRLAQEIMESFPLSAEDPTGLSRVLQSGEAELYAQPSEEGLARTARSPEHLRLLRELNISGAIHAPLRARGGVLGVLTFISQGTGRVFTENDLLLAQELAGRAAAALANARAHRESLEALETTRNAEARLSLALDHAGLGDWSWDLTTHQIRLSPRAAEIFGTPGGSLTWEEVQRRIHPRDLPRVLTEVRRVIGERADFDVEFRMAPWDEEADGTSELWEPLSVIPDGALPLMSEPEAWVAVRGRALYSPEGTAIGVLGVIQDITARREDEAALRASDERYRAFVAQSSEGIWRFEVRDPIPVDLPVEEQVRRMMQDGYLAECNDATAAMYGYESTAPMLGTPLNQFLDETDPANIEYLSAFVLSGYRLTDAESHEFDRDGQPRIFLNNLVGYVGGGRLIRAWGTQREITQQREAEHALRESQERLELATRAASIGAFDWDMVSGLVVWTEEQERLFGLAPGTFQGNQGVWAERLGQSEAERIRAEIAEALQRKASTMEFAYRIVRADGEERYLNASTRFLYAEDGTPLRMVGVTLDVTDHRRLEAQLRQKIEALAEADRRKDEFLAMLAHELRNPLAPIVNSIEVLRLALPSDSLLRRHREVIERNAAHLARLVDDLLDVSRLNEGKIVLHRERVPVADLVEQAVTTVRPQAEERGQELSVLVSMDPVWVEADPTRLVQVLTNLLSNACKFTPEGGRITVTAAKESTEAGESVVIGVRDTGRGIAPENLLRIFELFVQGEQTLARSDGGLGIGLTVVRRLVEMHGGTVTAESAGPGRGSRFTVRLPFLREESGRSGEEGHAPNAPAPMRGDASDVPMASGARTPSATLRILVVEDNRDTAETLVELLQLWEHEVAVARDGRAALDRAEAFQPQVVLMDLGLPDLNGYTVAARLQETGCAARLVALTGYGDAEHRQRVRDAGFHRHLVKPVDPQELRGVLAELAS